MVPFIVFTPEVGRIGDTSGCRAGVNLMKTSLATYPTCPQRTIRRGCLGGAFGLSLGVVVIALLANNSVVFASTQGTSRKLIPPATAPTKPSATPSPAPANGASSPPATAPTVKPTAPTTIKPPANAAKSTLAHADLELDPILLESLGMKIRLPKQAILTKPVTGAMPIYTVDDGADPTRFHMQIQNFVSALPDPTPQAQVADYLAGMRAKGQKFTVIADVPWIHDRVPGHSLYTSTDLGSGVVAVQGWLILQTGPFDFIVINTLMAQRDFSIVRPLIESAFSTIELEDFEKTAAKRNDRLRRGGDVLAAITPEILKNLCSTPPRLYRVYTTDESGKPQEIGYYRITVVAGNLSDASGEDAVPVRENPAGILVIVQGRTVVDAASGRFADTESRFWCAWDRQSEAWTSRITQRGGKDPERSFAQTGLRSPRNLGNPKQKLIVINADAQSRTRDQKEWTVPVGIYLSQAETLVLGELLPRDGTCAGDFAYYAFDPRSMQMPQRVETWTKAQNKQWLLMTQPGLDESAEVSLHDANGRRIRRTEPDGIITEECTGEALQEIWARQGLPTR